MEDAPLPSSCSNMLVTTPGTPYVCHQRYDAGPFLSYPIRIGQAAAGAAMDDPVNYSQAETMHPTPLRDKESFVQTWLYFGLVSELICINYKDDPNNPEAFEGSQLILDQMYDTMLVPDGDGFNVELGEGGLEELLELALWKLPKYRETKIRRGEHLLKCLAHAYALLAPLPKDFHHAVKYSIAGLCEIIAQAVRNLFSRLGVKFTFARPWADGYLDEQTKSSMMLNGWCRSDITRAEIKFVSIQVLEVVRMMDKSLPARDHSGCTDTECNIYHIDVEDYEVRHETPNCFCTELEIRSQDLEEVLSNGDRVPLLRLTGDLYDLKAEIVESDINTSYIAISHVWADGLGNPFANSLSRCKLARLRDLVSAIDSPDRPNPDPPLIWLDTLCCPAKDGPGKQKALEKIRLVYQLARHVLVLDAGIMSYESKSQRIREKVVRIFTSSWVRRLWTLQEAALAQSLYFQFADKAISLRDLRESLFRHANSIPRNVFALDSIEEFWRIDAFFKRSEHERSGDGPDIIVLDQALQFRGVSVPSDEPLCIGCLMSLDLPAILRVEPKSDRMQKIWELLAAKYGGISARVIFFVGQRIKSPGWRWAPQSLLAAEKSILKSNTHILRWAGGQLGTPTQLGLKVSYPGFRIEISKYEDKMPRNPWLGWTRIAEAYLHFRDSETGDWYLVGDMEYAYLLSKWATEEERKEHNKLELFPLHSVANSNKGVVITQAVPDRTNVSEAIFATLVQDERMKEERQGGDGIAVQTQRRIILRLLGPEEGHIYDTIRRLAMRLRADELTSRYLELCELSRVDVRDSLEDFKTKIEGNEDFKASMDGLVEKMKAMTAEVIKEDSRFVAAVETFMGSDLLEFVWVLIRDWFNRDFVATRVESEQVWYVD